MGKRSRKKASRDRSRQRAARGITSQPGLQTPRRKTANVASVVPPAFGGLPEPTMLANASSDLAAPSKRISAAGTSTRPAETDLTRLVVDEEQHPAEGCANKLSADYAPAGLAVTYTFDAPVSPEPYSIAIRFTGARVGLKSSRQAGERFERVERLVGLPADSGRVSITARVQGINAGEWRVTAAPIVQPDTPPELQRLPRRTIATTTTVALLAQGPSVRLTAWPVLVGLGAAVAIFVQALLVARADLNVLVVFAFSLIGCALGCVGGKVWCLLIDRKPLREFVASGVCIQGFLLVALGVLAIGAALQRLPVGTLLDATIPGVFFGMAIGRPGCFLTGCCAGRPTGSRWGLWSSDRRVSVRRVPVQLIEATAALILGLVTLVLVLTVHPPIPGTIFVGALAAYIFCRQLLFPLRTEARTPAGRMATMAICGLVVVAAVVVSVFS